MIAFNHEIALREGKVLIGIYKEMERVLIGKICLEIMTLQDERMVLKEVRLSFHSEEKTM